MPDIDRAALNALPDSAWAAHAGELYRLWQPWARREGLSKTRYRPATAWLTLHGSNGTTAQTRERLEEIAREVVAGARLEI